MVSAKLMAGVFLYGWIVVLRITNIHCEAKLKISLNTQVIDYSKKKIKIHKNIYYFTIEVSYWNTQWEFSAKNW